MLVGAHLDNVDLPPDSSYRRIRLMRAEVALTLWTAGTRHRHPVYEALAAAGVQRLCIRVGDEGIAGSVDDYLKDVDQAVNEAVAAGFTEDEIDCQILNEPNLRTTSPVTVGTFVGAVLRKWRRKARPLLPPVSRGKEDWQDYARAMLGAASPLPKNVGKAKHAYAQDAESIEPADPNGLPEVVTEFSHPEIGGRARGLWVNDRLKEFSAKGYGYACQFIVDGVTGGAWPEGYRMTDGEAIEIGQRGTLPEPEKTMPRTPMPNPWNQRLFTVWNLPSDPQEVVRACQAWGCTGVEIKIADGNSSWVGRRNVTKEYVDALWDAGFDVLSWSYNYCDALRNAGDRGDGVPEEEADVVLDAYRDLHLAGHTFDLEIECEGHGDLVAVLLDRFKKSGIPMAAHTWADLNGHDQYPIHEISVLVDVVRPMVYRPIWNAVDCLSSLSGRINDKPMIPVWGITEATPELLKIDRDVWQATTGSQAEAFWEFAARGREDLRAVVVGSAPPVPVPAPQPDRVAAVLAKMRADLDELERAIKEAA